MTHHDLSKLEEQVKNSYFSRSSFEALPGHGYDHVQRVEKWAAYIVQHDPNPEINVISEDMARATAKLHDLGRLTASRKEEEHAEMGSKDAMVALDRCTDFSEDEKAQICQAIAEHSLFTATTALGKVLQDADRLEGFGAIGIYRAFISKPRSFKLSKFGKDPLELYESDPKPSQINCYLEQLAFQRRWSEMMNTETGKHEAEQLVKVMDEFVKQLLAETANSEA